MKAFASLHTAKPSHSGEHEASYAGYKRVPLEWTAKFGRQAAEIVFPEITETEGGVANYVAISSEESGPGGILQLVEVLPNIPLMKPAIPEEFKDHPVAKRPYCPRVVFSNIPEPLPEDLHPIAVAAWHLVNNRELDPADLPHKLFEALNDEFAAHGVKVMTVTRCGAAAMNAKISQMKSLNLSSAATSETLN